MPTATRRQTRTAAPAANAVQCYYCGAMTTTPHLIHNGQPLCPSCFVNQAFTCVACERSFFTYDRGYNCDSPGACYCYACWDRISTWEQTPVEYDGKMRELRSARRFGIELETSACTNYRSLQSKTVYGAKYDGSISGMEFVSPILQGDKGLWATRGFCTRAKHNGFEVDDDCGYHLHIDVSNNTDLQRRHIAAAYAHTYPFWCRLVNSYRAYDCHYCHDLEWRAEDMATAYRFTQFCNRLDRYMWFNMRSFPQHGTFEIRLHEGTIDSRRICNWVKAHVRFADFVQDMKFSAIARMFNVSEKQMWRAVTNTWADPALRRYFS